MQFQLYLLLPSILYFECDLINNMANTFDYWIVTPFGRNFPIPSLHLINKVNYTTRDAPMCVSK